MTDLIEITQADREVLAAILRDTFPNITDAGSYCLSGAYDNDKRMQCIARHRIATAQALEARVRELEESLRNPPKHKYWGAGEPDCPREIKAGNGELHTLRCKVCGQDSPRSQICFAAIQGMVNEA